MIRITRSQKPAILDKKEAAWLTALQNATTKAAKKRAEEKYRHEKIQQALSTMHHGKCAYCESKIEHISHAHIEHYRPKSKFEALTFTWENLLWACSICNSDCKRDQFPETAEGGPLINPCDENPEDHLQFEYDSATKIASVYGKTARGVTTEELVKLNRPQLRTHRSRHVKRLAYLAVLAPTNSEAKQLLEEAKQDDAEYAVFARML